MDNGFIVETIDLDVINDVTNQLSWQWILMEMQQTYAPNQASRNSWGSTCFAPTNTP